MLSLIRKAWLKLFQKRPARTGRLPAGPAGQERGKWRLLDQFEAPSRPGSERQVMERVAGVIGAANLRWAEDVSAQRLERLKTAVAEAAMNAMEHGNQYRGDRSTGVEVLAYEVDGLGRELVVRIRDFGGGQAIPESETPDLDAKLAGLQSPRGWGLFLIKNMVDDVRVYSDATYHTVELVLHVPGAPR